MDLNEAGQRIFRRHWALILLLTLVGLAVPVALAKVQQAQYVATARMDLGTDVRGGQEANSLADTALAIATSPDVLSTVLKETKAPRSQLTVVTELQVVPVGTSGVLEMSVTDPDARISASLVNALATTVVKVRNATQFGGTETLLSQVQQQYATVTGQISAIETQIQKVSQQPAFTPTDAQNRGAELSTLAIEHSTLLAQQSRLDGQRQQLIQTLASATRPNVIDDSSKLGIPAQNSLSTRIAVGGLLGLLLGVAIAAVREALRPSLNLAALARRVDAPVLGTLSGVPPRDGPLEDPWLEDYLTVAADAAGVRTVQLVAVGGKPMDVSGLAQALDGRNGLRVLPLTLSADVSQRVPGAARDDAGIVIVAPKLTKGRSLQRLEQHLSVTRQRVVGVLGVRPGDRANRLPGKSSSRDAAAFRAAVVQDPAATSPAGSAVQAS